MSIITVDTRSRTPIWQQLAESVKDNILREALKPGEKLPSVRELAGELAINPNTIQKAYTELERVGVVYSIPGKGSFVTEDIRAFTGESRKNALGELKAAARNALDAGCSPEELAETLRQVIGGIQ